MAATRHHYRLALLGLATFFSGAGQPDQTRVGSAPTILEKLVPAWLDAFAHVAPGDSVMVAPPFGPPQGRLDPALTAFLEGRRSFAFLTRDISEADLATYRAHHGGAPVVMPVAGGAWNRFGYVDPIVVIVHSSNPLRAISYQQLDTLLSDSHWRGGMPPVDWAGLGLHGWKGRAIHVVGGGAWAGEESARALTIRRRVLSNAGHVGRWHVFPGSGDEANVVQRVGSDPLAIGFTGLGHLSGDVRVVAISDGRGSAVFPTRTAIASGAYPLARTVDLLLARTQGRCLDPVLVRFARFLIGASGQEIVRRQTVFLPLTRRQRRQARDDLDPPCR